MPPISAYLAHESCELNGEVFAVGGGQVLHMALIQSKGIYSENLSPEFVAENIGKLMDLKDADLFGINAEIR